MSGSVEDKFAVMEVSMGYSGAASRLSPEDLASYFAEDAVVQGLGLALGLGEGVDLVGPNGVRDGFAPSFKELEFLLQLSKVAVINVTGDRATAEVLITEFCRRKNGGKMMVVCATYDDEYRRTARGWKFTMRRFTPKTVTVVAELPFSDA